MAATSVKIVRAADGAADVDTLDLMAGLSSDTGIVIVRNGWQQQVAPYNASPRDRLTEVITLHIKGTSTDDLASKVQTLDAKIQQVRDWISDADIANVNVWLRVQGNSETKARQAIIYSISGGSVPALDISMQVDFTIEDYQLTIVRAAFWEDPYTYPTTTAISSINVIGGLATIADTLVGDVPGRLLTLTVDPAANTTLNEFWVGWKTNRLGTATNLESVWPTSYGLVLDDDTTLDVSDSTAYNTYKSVTTFATVPAMAPRLVVQATGGHYSDQRGKYQVLLRARMTDTTSSAQVRIAYGFSGGADGIRQPTYNQPVIVSSPVSATYWNLYEMGSVSIPPAPLLTAGTTTINMSAITCNAAWVSGTGYLEWDCLILIPINDGAVKATASGDLSHSQPFTIGQHTNEQLYGDGEGTGPLAVHPVNFTGIPPGASIVVVFAGQNTDQNVKNATAAITYSYIPRWRTLRGGE